MTSSSVTYMLIWEYALISVKVILSDNDDILHIYHDGTDTFIHSVGMIS